MKWLSKFCLVLGLVVAGAGPGSAVAIVPKFADYPAKISAVRAPLRLRAGDMLYRTRLRNAYELPVNFGGRYVLTLWGCGADCLMGAAINVVTGEVVWIPFSLCCSSYLSDEDANFEPVEARKNSRLVVFTGKRERRGAASFMVLHDRGRPLEAS
jgi:hypothetical protein